MTLADHVVTCDESGSEGEAVVEAQSRVFAHASHDLTLPEAEHLIGEVRRRCPSQAPEFKSKQFLRPDYLEEQLWFLRDSDLNPERSYVFLVDKSYFVPAKVIDLLIEELACDEGHDIYADGSALRMARDLHREGPRALGAQRYLELIGSFNSLMRTNDRKNAKVTVEEFFDLVDSLRERSTRRLVDDVLNLLLRCRPHAESFQKNLVADSDTLPSLDPLFAAVPQAGRAWYQRTRRPVRILHDQQSALTERRIAAVISYSNNPLPEFDNLVPRGPIASIHQGSSQNDARIQVADLLAGVGRAVAETILAGNSDPRVVALRPHLHGTGLWADDASWMALAGQPL